jgi:hypothetical protein
MCIGRSSLLAIALALILLLTPAGASANSFHVECTSSHVASDDPIVFPGQPGAAHRHEFFGSRSTDAGSTTTSLAAADTSCASPRDTAAYWVPTLELRGRLVRGSMVAYYQRAGKRRAEAPPSGLRVIAGDMHATSPQPLSVASWQCTGRSRGPHRRTLPACARGQQLAAWLRYPDCWDGRRLDSPDHRSHLAYATGGTCPRSHPVGIMKLVTRVTWPVRPASADLVTLGGGMLGPLGLHGDFWNAWHQPTLRQLRWDCIEIAAPCGALSP